MWRSSIRLLNRAVHHTTSDATPASEANGHPEGSSNRERSSRGEFYDPRDLGVKIRCYSEIPRVATAPTRDDRSRARNGFAFGKARPTRSTLSAVFPGCGG